jgi:hypothetical protein
MKTELLESVKLAILEGRIKIVKARVRGGKVQRRKKVKDPSLAGKYKMVGGKIAKESPAEKMRRKRGAKKGAIKRKAKAARALIARKKSLRKRAAIGL